ncbi:MAG: hypothetical protein K6U11_13210 [bacterium]|nr:hypothetical protein [bacterium]
MSNKFIFTLSLTIFAILAAASFFVGTALAQFFGTHTYAIRVGSIEQGYLTVTFNPDGTILGKAQLLGQGRQPIPLSGIYGETIFVIKYTLEDGTEVLDHCRFISEDEFIGFERYVVDGDIRGITKISGLKKDNI